ncbi:hypothetical protein BRARA_G00122 [Brassica rapa]|uniref:Embryo surrounding factor 1 brassicaceae domain-containing protein n=2 Tax=Brassica campestris TaxID=3711 RepID=A0A397YRT5_BRACM|nr:hypothetical protein IGI04_025902 [Brassica rapa subsp. trilocularis]RID52673.1 hypothetical protein BRARA_G00122 [Brassica rapa]VDC95401.1 unnamed protein product [Brassica rapa]
MISKTTFIYLFMFSLYALHQFTQLDAGEIESSSKIILPPKCVPYICYGVNCWCCKRDPVGDGQCFKTLEECKSNRKCPWL